ncbi:MAG: penicillin-binding protein 2, partial [bacterium]
MNNRLSKLNVFYKLITVAVFAVLTIRFVQLQLYHGEQYLHESERNRIRELSIEPPRGLVYDQNGEILVDNRPSYSVFVVPYEVLRSDTTLKLLSSILDQPVSQIKKKIAKERIGNFTPVKVRRHIDFTVLSDLEEHRLELPGVFYKIESKRFYPSGIRAPHIFGYLGEITSQELVHWKKSGYRQGDLIGKKGLELQYEKILRGKPGVKYVEVDALGREVRDLTELSTILADPGEDVFLTIRS